MVILFMLITLNLLCLTIDRNSYYKNYTYLYKINTVYKYQNLIFTCIIKLTKKIHQ